MDICPAATCRFFVGNTSGLFCAPLVFDIPVAMTNAIPFTTMMFNRSSYFIPKLLRIAASGAPVTFADAHRLGLFDHRCRERIYLSEHFHRLGLLVDENDEEDVRDVFLDILDLIEGVAQPEGIREVQLLYRDRFLSEYPYIEHAGLIGRRFALWHRDLVAG